VFSITKEENGNTGKFPSRESRAQRGTGKYREGGGTSNKRGVEFRNRGPSTRGKYERKKRNLGRNRKAEVPLRGGDAKKLKESPGGKWDETLAGRVAS